MVYRKTSRKRWTIQWSKEKQTDKGRQYNGLKKNKQTKVDHTMVKRKQTDKGQHYHGLKKNKQTKVDNTMVYRKTNRQRSTIQ